MHDETTLYRQMSALHSKDFNTCFYCGCIATKYDLAPPIKFAQFYLTTHEEADFYSVPACRECFDFLKNDKSALLGQRVDIAKRKLVQKYQRAIRIYEVWEQDEIDDLSYQLKHSVNAGMVLGKESSERVKFAGFDFEADGEKHSAHYVKNEVFTVFDEKFDNFRGALDYASKAYRIPKAKLIEMFTVYNNCFDTAINIHHQKIAGRIFDKHLKAQCRDFSLKHQQNIKFVMRTVESFCEQDQSLTVEMALRKLYRERLKKSSLAVLTPA